MKAILGISRDKAILEGHENYGNREINFNVSELTKEEREALITASTTYVNNECVYNLSDISFGTDSPSINEVKEVLQHLIQKNKLKKIKQEEEKEADIQKILTDYTKAMTSDNVRYSETYNSQELIEWYAVYRIYDHIQNHEDKRIQDIIPELENLANKRTEESLEYAKEKINNKIEMIKLKEASEAKKEKWILKCGSERLQTGYKAGYNVQTLYITELGLQKLGSDYVFDSKNQYNVNVRNNPSLEALNEEKKMKAKNFLTEIVWVTSDDEYDEYDEYNSDEYEAIHIVLEEKYDFYKRI